MPRPTLYWLLVFVPISLVAQFVLEQPVLVFVASCVAIVPLAALIGRATDQLAERSGPMVGGLLNATFGNVTELIIGILLVWAHEFDVVKASLIGSILGNLVLVLGASYLFGGLRHGEQRFDRRAARLHSSSLLLAIAGMVMPAAFVQFFGHETPAQTEVISLVVAAVLIVLYISALVFTLGPGGHRGRRANVVTAPIPREAPEWTTRRSVIVLLGAAVTVGVESELLVDTLEPTLAALHLPKVFVGLFVIAFIGNVAEHASAVVFALRDKMEIAIEISFSSSTQIALLVAPLLVFVSLLSGHRMDFVFIPIEVVAVTLATLIVSVIALDGRSNWLEGAQLLGVYVILAVSTLFFTG
ncbi:MAG TPA: calcium/proton exchanger [Candidatus Eisenbacteria bacterium]|nr:calcium/proton exchanger [Candidatus Eisenbacteria bacterium]